MLMTLIPSLAGFLIDKNKLKVDRFIFKRADSASWAILASWVLPNCSLATETGVLKSWFHPKMSELVTQAAQNFSLQAARY